MGQVIYYREHYYLDSECQHCGSEQKLHIGWRDTDKPFVFRYYRGIGTYSAWVKKLLEGDISDADGKQVDLRSFLLMVERHKEDLGSGPAPLGTIFGGERYLFCNEYKKSGGTS